MDDEQKNEAGEALKYLRMQRGISQQKLADRSKVSQTTIDKIEKGLIRRSKYLPEIARALGVAPSTIDPAFAGAEPALTGGMDTKPVIQTRVFKEKHPGFIPAFATYSLAAEFSFDDFEKLGLCVVSSQPLRMAERPRFLGDDPDAYALYVSENSMSPEFEPGDVIFASPAHPIIVNTSCVFYGQIEEREACVIGRLIRYNDEEWEMMKWGPQQSRLAKRSVFKRAHRIVARHVR